MTISAYDRENVGLLLADKRCNWFSAQLLRLIAHADGTNRAKLRQVYPDHVAAYEAYAYGDGRARDLDRTVGS